MDVRDIVERVRFVGSDMDGPDERPPEEVATSELAFEPADSLDGGGLKRREGAVGVSSPSSSESVWLASGEVAGPDSEPRLKDGLGADGVSRELVERGENGGGPWSVLPASSCSS